jgi:dinuclear metal center YbgI/SA1388 family protein
MAIKIKDIISCIEEVAPLSFQEDYDNSGLIVGDREKECKGVYVCLDVFSSSVKEAINKGCNLIISHHPFIFHSIKKLNNDDEITKILTLAIKNDISIYASHTAIDSSIIGVNDILAKELGLKNIERLVDSQNTDKNYLGIGAIGYLSKAVPLNKYLLFVKQKLNIPSLRYVGKDDYMVSKIAICGGSGISLVDDAIEKHCDLLLTGDIKYHDFLTFENQISIADIGHFESEQFIKQRIIEIISKKFSNFAPLILSSEPNRVKFI